MNPYAYLIPVVLGGWTWILALLFGGTRRKSFWMGLMVLSTSWATVSFVNVLNLN